MIAQADLIARLDDFFKIGAFNESTVRAAFSPDIVPIFEQYAVPGFSAGGWNGLMLNNTPNVDRIYLVVFPAQPVLDTIIAREVQRGAPGALIFSHHLTAYPANDAPFNPIPEPQLEELHEHHVSFYLCHAPLACHPQISPSGALAEAFKVREPERFAAAFGGQAGVHGKFGPIGFNELAKRAAEVTGLAVLRYSAIRNNGRAIQHIGILAGATDPTTLREAAALGIDTLITGEWWPFGAGETHIARRSEFHDVLINADLNLIGTSHYASEAVVMREQLPTWLRANVPGVEVQFVVQDDPAR